MIKTETYTIEGDSVVLIRTYSDRNMMIRQDGTGILYSEAVDPQVMNRTYTETDIPIESEEEETPSGDEEDMIAHETIDANKYFLVGDTLYYSTAVITNGETISPGMNCNRIDVANALNTLSSE